MQTGRQVQMNQYQIRPNSGLRYDLLGAPIGGLGAPIGGFGGNGGYGGYGGNAGYGGYRTPPTMFEEPYEIVDWTEYYIPTQIGAKRKRPVIYIAAPMPAMRPYGC